MATQLFVLLRSAQYFFIRSETALRSVGLIGRFRPGRRAGFAADAAWVTGAADALAEADDEVRPGNARRNAAISCSSSASFTAAPIRAYLLMSAGFNPLATCPPTGFAAADAQPL